MSEIRVLVNGAKGRMGSESVQAVREAADLELVAQTDLGDDLAATIASSGAQVVVDFTVPASAVENATTILDSDACPVVGTTGFTSADIEGLQAKATGLGRGGLIAPNFAIGAVLLMKFAQQAAKFLPDVEVIELHHDQKVDAPSGTALKTIELIRESLDQQAQAPGKDRPKETETVAGARGGEYLGSSEDQGRFSRSGTTPYRGPRSCPELSSPFAKSAASTGFTTGSTRSSTCRKKPPEPSPSRFRKRWNGPAV